MSKFCCDCIHWEKLTPITGDAFGICHDVGVAMNVALDGRTKLGDGGALWTSAYFGCVYWRDKGNEVVGFDDIIDNDTGELK
jgi:hypothetical protein